ncbi:hypothetical protein CYMTET_52860 [Cymbomonas tetramitiformis]|uniref:Uncharacterized protein n=1 Tax=Cymbomonas tetramitiformis TaxID=36881 RepID=A0AAE0EQD8_9CHLO|nr:hypothetical protein CYMTET_52860 [Cymbomonas tetramitiformis]
MLEYAVALGVFTPAVRDASGKVGLGGARDATNVFPPSILAAAVLTNIDEEHLAALGGTLTSITNAKAGIMKRGRPVIVAHQSEPVAAVALQAEASAKGAILVDAAMQVQAHNNSEVLEDEGGPHQFCDFRISRSPGGGMRKDGGENSWELAGVKLRMLGQHQQHNAAAALCTLQWLRQHQGWDISPEALRKGLESAQLPARFQVLQLLGGEAASAETVVLDGAHTPAAARALAETLQQVFSSRHVALVVAMADDKNHGGVLAGLARIDMSAIVFTEVAIAGSSMRSAQAAQLACIWEAHGNQTAAESMEAASLESAIQIARKKVGRFGVVVITGSLHACALSLEHLQPYS